MLPTFTSLERIDYPELNGVELQSIKIHQFWVIWQNTDIAIMLGEIGMSKKRSLLFNQLTIFLLPFAFFVLYILWFELAITSLFIFHRSNSLIAWHGRQHTSENKLLSKQKLLKSTRFQYIHLIYSVCV